MVFKGKTVAEAISAGLSYYSITEEQAEIKVLAEEVKGLFGKVKKEAEVDVSVKLSGGSRAVQFLEGLFEKMDLSAKAELVSEGENIVINVITTSSSAVIGYRGEVLDALQALAGAVANIGNKNYKRVVVDCEGYREKREETLVNLANKLADKAVRLGRDVSLEPMNPYERRVIHSTLAASETVTTASEGKEPNRHVVIIPNEKKPYVKKYNDRNRGGNRNYGGRRDDRRGDRRDRGGRGGRSGFSSLGREPKKKPTTFGTYLGNSLKDE
ncbi:MAG: RNA-binding cell elongation regulator Jag/EloR [Eubacteriales bacterium]